MIQVVQEFKTTDGIGAMLWKKIYAMCYAYRYNLLFKDTPFEWFLIHPSDKAEDEQKYKKTLKLFNSLLRNPWKGINFDLFEWQLSDKVGKGSGSHPGFADHYTFLTEAPLFNPVGITNTSDIVIHMRRSNATKDNPRYTEDLVYVNILKQIDTIAEQLNIVNPTVILLTDAPDKPTTYSPTKKDIHQYNMWHQPWLDKDENDEWPLSSVNWDMLKQAYPNLIIQNKLDTYSSFMLMLNAKLLIPAYSAFSQSAGLLTHNYVLSWPEKHGMDPQMNYFKNSIGNIDSLGNITINNNTNA